VLTKISHLYILMTMNYTTINAKTDPELKNKATILADELGISLSVVINTALRNFVAERRLVISGDYVPNAFLRDAITLAEKELSKKQFHRTESKDEITALISGL